MKKLLALVLAMVMTLGLATVSSSAAYSDEADVSLNEAVDVMSTVGVFQGADGKFSPKANLNREQAAKLIAYLDLGESAAEALPAVQVFSDVPATSWSAKYIAYCADAGYIVGDGTGKFNPTGELNGYAFGKMVLCVLGYDADIEGFVGNNWSINVAKLMESNDIADGIDSAASLTLTREQAAQYCLNALKATMVDYANKGTNVTINGAVIATGASKAEPVTASVTNTAGNYTQNAYAVALSGAVAVGNTADVTVQLGEKLYNGKLVLDNVVDNGRQSRSWSYKGDSVGDNAAFDDVLATSNGGTDFDKLITKGQTGYINVKADDEITVYENGAAFTTGANTVTPNSTFSTSNATELAALIAEGKNHDDAGSKIEFIDTDSNGKWDVVAITDYTFSRITRTTAEKSDGTEATITIRGIAGAIDESDVKGDFAGLAKDDYVVYAHINNPVADDYYLVYEPTTLDGQVTAYTSSKVTIGGTAYTFTKGVTNATTLNDVNTAKPSSKTDYTFYVDANGYVIAYDGVSTTTEYLVVDRMIWTDGTTLDATTGKAEARVFFFDGTAKNVVVSKIGGTDASYNATAAYASAEVDNTTAGNDSVYARKIYSYKVDKDGEYEITAAGVAPAASTASIKKGVASVTAGTAAVTNTSTTYLYKAYKSTSPNYTLTVYTGYSNAPTVASNLNVFTSYVTKSGYATFVYVDSTGANGTTNANTNVGGDTTTDVIVFAKDSYTTEYDGDDTYYVYQASINGGEVQSYKAEKALTLYANVLYEVSIDSDGYIDAVDGDQDFTDDLGTENTCIENTSNNAWTYTVATADAKGGALKVNDTINGIGKTLTFDGTEKVYFIGDETVTEGNAADIQEGMFLWVKTQSKSGTDAEKVAMKTVFVLDAIDDIGATSYQYVVGTANNTATTTALNTSVTTLAIIEDTSFIGVSIDSDDAGALNFITIDGAAGTDKSVSGTGDITTATGGNNYAVVTGDEGEDLTITVKTYKAGCTAIINTYKIALT